MSIDEAENTIRKLAQVAEDIHFAYTALATAETQYHLMEEKLKNEQEKLNAMEASIILEAISHGKNETERKLLGQVAVNENEEVQALRQQINLAEKELWQVQEERMRAELNIKNSIYQLRALEAISQLQTTILQHKGNQN